MSLELYRQQNRSITDREAAQTRARLLRRGSPVDLSDPQVDQEWAQNVDHTRARNPYLSYFFTGSDVQIHVAELGNDEEFGALPIQGFSFSVSQTKQPVYGYNSFTYDYVMRGTRIVQGALSLVTKYPEYMQRLLARAASNRADRQGELADSYAAFRGLTEDDANIERYWGKNIDPVVAASGRNEWSVHPPFSLVVVYGHEGTYTDDLEQMMAPFGHNNAMFTDYNQRLVDEPLGDNSNRLMIEACELQRCNRSYESQGSVLVETYQFLARDVLIPRPGNPGGGKRSASTPPLGN